METKEVTIVDIAEHAGVGVSTVSRVLNNHIYVSEDTRQGVLETIEKLGYRPNIAARSLVRKEVLPKKYTKDIGVLLSDWVNATDSYFSQVLQGIEEVIRAKRYNLSLLTISEGLLDNFELVEKIISRGIKAAILIGTTEERTISCVRDNLEAVVLVDATTTVPGVDIVTCDNEQGSYDAVCHLLNLGHRKISLIRGPLSHYFGMALNRGYKRALADFNVSYDESAVAEGDFHPDGGCMAMKELLKLSELPTALFSNDDMAMGAMRAIREKGLRVPEDIAVVGFDDSNLASHTHPPLTTVCVPKKSLGRIAANKLSECLDNPTTHESMKTVIPLQLVIRESCGANLGLD